MIQMPKMPNEISGKNVLLRIIDSIKFRFQVATHDLDQKNFSFKSSEEAMTLENLLKHIYHLQKGILLAYSKEENKNEDPQPSQYIQATVDLLDKARAQIESMSDQELLESSFHKYSSWHIINGPIADTLTHIGQINMMRRMFGKPTPKANVLAGTFETENK